MEKSLEQMKLDVNNANSDLDTHSYYKNPHQRIRAIFEILSAKYAWTEENFIAYYPEETIGEAKTQGWKV